MTRYTSAGIAYQRADAAGGVPVLLLHAGVADRRMWRPQWDGLAAAHDVIACDLRGFGDSSRRPSSGWSQHGDVVALLDELDIARAHLIGVSLGAGVAVEVALARPDRVASVLLVSPGGCLIAGRTEELEEFIKAENVALARDDVDAAVEANLRWWIDGPRRSPVELGPGLRRSVAQMQRRAFELTADWDENDEVELEPPASGRLAEVRAPAMVLYGGQDIDAIIATGEQLAAHLPHVDAVRWEDTAHLLTLERPDDFLRLALDWLAATQRGALSGV